ncbi:MAG: transglycosylase domain-containing protein, partial [Pseudobdellovibrionaceae bacterium]
LSSPRGGSTITMQMAKLLSSKNDLYSGQFGKIRQIIFAHKLETSWSKDEILEAYLNLTYFRGELQGLRAASLGLFHKEPVGLNDSESAILSALIRSPQAEPQRVSERACLLLGVTTCGDIQDLARTLENKYSVPQGANWASHLTRILIKENPEATFMQSTLDSELQKMVIGVVTEQISQLTQRNVEDAAVLVIHNKTGEVRAYVGSTGPLSKSSQVDGVRSLRQAGSTLKPFLYGLAFENRIIEPDSWIEDSAVEIVFKNGVYRPQNHDKNFRGWVKVHQALAASLNTPAVRVYQMLGEDQVFDTFKSLDFVLKEPEYYGSAFALGVADVSLWSLTNAYRTFANHGIYSELTLTPRQEDEALKKESVFSEETAKKINKILSSNTSRAITFGLDSPLSTPFPSAVKTGTSKDMRDNWCLGYTEDYTVGVWVGNFNGEPMWNVLGVTGAGPIWQRVITWLHENRKEGTRHLAAEDAEGENASEVKTTPQQYPGARILYPPSGMIMAIDREIPAKNQKVPLLAEVPNHRRYHWQIGDKKLAVNSQDTLWTPIPGRHQIDLFVEGKLVESAEVIVK